MKLLKKIWGIWFYLIFVGIFFALYPAFWWLLRDPKGYASANKLRKLWGRLLFIIIGIRWKIAYETPLDPAQVYIYCPNHSSYLDIPMAALCVKGYFHYMAKKELARIPFFGIFFRTVDVMVDRSSKTGSFRAFQQAKENLLKRQNLVIFPEGTTSKNAPEMLRFKSGAFRLAIENKIPIVPVTFVDNWRLFRNDGEHAGRPGLSRAIVHRPIDTIDMTETDVDGLSEKVHDIIEQTLKRYANK